MSERLMAAAAANITTDAGDPPVPPGPPTVPHILLVREAVAMLGWGTMTYACDACGFEWEIWLGLGVEGPPALREHGLYVASPFGVGRCPAWPIRPDATEQERRTLRHMATCDGNMGHVRWGDDRQFEPRLIPDDAPRFMLGAWDGAELVIPEPALVRARRYHADQDARASTGTPVGTPLTRRPGACGPSSPTREDGSSRMAPAASAGRQRTRKRALTTRARARSRSRARCARSSTRRFHCPLSRTRPSGSRAATPGRCWP